MILSEEGIFVVTVTDRQYIKQVIGMFDLPRLQPLLILHVIGNTRIELPTYLYTSRNLCAGLLTCKSYQCNFTLLAKKLNSGVLSHSPVS